jgi:hypothetical protein
LPNNANPAAPFGIGHGYKARVGVWYLNGAFEGERIKQLNEKMLPDM